MMGDIFLSIEKNQIWYLVLKVWRVVNKTPNKEQDLTNLNDFVACFLQAFDF